MAAKGVNNAFIIYPTSGSMNMSPAKLLIQDDAKFPCIMYKTSAPEASKVLPAIRREK